MKIVVELTEKEIYLGNNVWWMNAIGIENKKEYLIGINEAELGESQIGDIVVLWGTIGDVRSLLPLIKYDNKGTECFLVEKLELMTPYSEKVRDVLDI
jgi:hypothetical protein